MSETPHLRAVPAPEDEPITVAGVKRWWPFVVFVALASIAWADVKIQLANVADDRSRLIRIERSVAAIRCDLKPENCRDAMAGVGP